MVIVAQVEEREFYNLKREGGTEGGEQTAIMGIQGLLSIKCICRIFKRTKEVKI